MTDSQILLSIIIIFILIRTIIAFRKKSLTTGFTLVWFCFWLFGLFLIYDQQFVINIAHKLGISRGVDLVIYLSLIFIFYMVYKLLVKIEELERSLTEIVRNIALKEKKRKLK